MSIASDLQTLATNLASILGQINTKLTGKGSTAASTLSGVPDKIDAIETGITPTGTKNITQNGTHDVTDYAAAYVNVPTGIDTSDANGQASDFASGKSGYVNGVKVVGTQPERSSSNLTASGKTVTVPAGLYREQATKDVSVAVQATPTLSLNGSTGIVTATSDQSAGYVVAGTKTATLPVTHPNLTAGNIKKNVNIFDITGTYTGEESELHGYWKVEDYGSASASQIAITYPDDVGLVKGVFVFLVPDAQSAVPVPSSVIASFVATENGYAAVRYDGTAATAGTATVSMTSSGITIAITDNNYEFAVAGYYSFCVITE